MDYIDLLIKAKIEQAKNKGEREKRNPATIYKKKKKQINNMKRTIRLTESELHRIIEESVNSVIKEHYEDRPEEIGKLPEDNYYGGGLPDAYFNEDDFVDTGITENQIAGLKDSMDYIADIANNVDLDTDLLFQACDCIEKFLTNNCA